MLDALQERGAALGVVSNKPDPFTQKCVHRLFSKWSWDGIAGQRDGVPKKPDPTGALTLAKTMGAAPEDCWFVGDSDVDMQTADAAGMYAVGALWGFRSAEELFENGARMVAATPFDLSAWFQRDGGD